MMKTKTKPKSPKPIKNGTGAGSTKGSQLQIEDGGLTLKNDVVYGRDTDAFRAFTSSGNLNKEQVDSITGWGLKYELSPTQIVLTIQTIVPQPFQTENSTWLTDTRRIVYNGTFQYRGNKLVGNLQQIATSWAEGISQTAPPGTKFTDKYSNREYDFYWKERYSYNGNPQASSQSTLTYGIDNYYNIWGNDGVGSGSQDDLAWFRSYENGKFFGENWWESPFASNLI